MRDNENDEDVLFIDGHGSRIIPDVWDWVLDQGVHVQFLKSHSSTEAQMLDLGFNAYFKKLLKKHFKMPDDPTAAKTREGLLCVRGVRWVCMCGFFFFLFFLFFYL
jgi:hypothetical protein